MLSSPKALLAEHSLAPPRKTFLHKDPRTCDKSPRKGFMRPSQDCALGGAGGGGGLRQPFEGGPLEI